MDSAELYMMLIRPSMIPIIGEAWTIPFNLQIELATWGWTLKNPDEDDRAKKAAEAYTKREGFLADRGSANLRKKNTAADRNKDLAKQTLEYENLQKTDEWAKKSDVERMKAWNDYKKGFDRSIAASKKAIDDIDVDPNKKKETPDEQEARERAEQVAKADLNLNFKFQFSKRVDFASTQMLNSMKQGDLFPTGIITLFQRAPNLNHAASLIMTFSKVRLLEYKLRCEVSDTMTDMREDWTAEFFSLSYVYKGRGMIKKESGAALVTAAVTQGTPRVFSMSMEGTAPI